MHTNIDHSTERHQWKNEREKTTKNALHCYFKSNSTQRKYRQIIIEISTRSTRFNEKTKYSLTKLEGC